MATLKAGLESNRLIGTAVGLLMAEHHIGRRTAFAYLRRTSQNTNEKVARVATQIVERAESETSA